MARERLDNELVARGLAASRSYAQRLIMAGEVRLDGHMCDRASQLVTSTQQIAVVQRPQFVSRGGDKLANGLADCAAAITAANLTIDGALVIDIGASTGGFSDCLLQAGAARVICVDVGYGQLHPKLREDPRVTVMERTNARYLTPDMLPYEPNLLVCDASFIGLATVLPAPIACLAPNAWAVVLIKPQFEAGRKRLAAGGRKGVLTDAKIRHEVVTQTLETLVGLGTEVVAHATARPAGPKGNVEEIVVLKVTD